MVAIKRTDSARVVDLRKSMHGGLEEGGRGFPQGSEEKCHQKWRDWRGWQSNFRFYQGPILDDLVQFEEDFNGRKTSSENSRKTSENS